MSDGADLNLGLEKWHEQKCQILVPKKENAIYGVPFFSASSKFHRAFSIPTLKLGGKVGAKLGENRWFTLGSDFFFHEAVLFYL